MIFAITLYMYNEICETSSGSRGFRFGNAGYKLLSSKNLTSAQLNESPQPLLRCHPLECHIALGKIPQTKNWGPEFYPSENVKYPL